MNGIFRSAWSWPADSRMNSPYPNRRPPRDRWKLMSVTLFSGIMATLRVSSPEVRIIRRRDHEVLHRPGRGHVERPQEQDEPADPDDHHEDALVLQDAAVQHDRGDQP